jgi:hypothetical protein
MKKKTLKRPSLMTLKSAPLNDIKAIPKIEFEKCFKDWQKYQMGTTLKETTYILEENSRYFFNTLRSPK